VVEQAIIDAFKKVHPLIAKYVYSQSANKLMLEESEIMTSVLLKLKEREIPSVPIHDSLLFPIVHTDVVKQVMLECYNEHTHFDIQVK
jgi:hypothetical protein